MEIGDQDQVVVERVVHDEGLLDCVTAQLNSACVAIDVLVIGVGVTHIELVCEVIVLCLVGCWCS